MKRTFLPFFILLLLSMNLMAQDSREISPELRGFTQSNPTEAMWDVVFDVNIQAATGGALGHAGVVWIPTLQQFWVSRWASGSIIVFNAAGTAVDSFVTSGFTGTRGLTWDGEFVYAVANTAAIRKIDPATRATVATITTPSTVTGRFVSFDPTADGGNGGFWMGNWNAGNLNYYLVSRTGALLTQINNTAITGTYGLTWDGRSPGGPYLWVWSQGAGANTPQNIIQISIATGQPTGVQHDVLTDVGLGNAGAIGGGLFLSTDFVAGKLVLGGVLQGVPDRLFAYELLTLDAGVLQPFNLTAPAAGTVVTSVPNSTTPVTITWDTSRAGASYKWIFGSPTVPPRLLTFPAGSNSLTLTLGQIDQLLAENGVPPGGSVVGQWDVWAFRGNLPDNDSLKAANGPRAITLQRALPALTPFALSNPANNSTVVTSVFNGTPVNINWRKSGDGVTYKWKFGTGLKGVNAVVLTLPANGGGYDTALTVINNQLDAVLGTLGVNPGDSISGQWAVWAYNGLDSLRSTDVFNITFKRQGKGDVLIAYDSSSVACRASKDSVSAWLSGRGISFDLFNRGTNTSTNAISFRGYKKVLFIGEGTSSMSIRQKDSLKAYLSNPPQGQRSRAAIFSEDIGYNYGRSASTYYDLDFVNNWLGWNFVLDRPASGANQGLVGSHINFNIPDSTVGSWPDVISRFDPNTTHDLYKFRGDGATNAIGKVGATYTIVTFGVDLESLRPAIDGPGGSPIGRFLDGAFQYLDTDGTIPVELTSFKGSVTDGVVRLEWTTATEVNNAGFEIERKSQNGTFQNIGFKPGYGTTSEPKVYSFADNSVPAGTYIYRLKQVDHDGTFSYSPEVEVDVTAPAEFSLSQNYPNPFNPSTTIKFGLRVESRVSLKIFNTLGQEVMLLISENREAGVHSLSFDASKLSSGVYFYKIEANGVDGSTFAETKKMILTK
ncbi:MAG: T9SS type A sorting domain-containing protein [Ignavibacteriales bacterium]|nr:MAG: T9SS type A sorting domain-containing protein [Ignavibacteriales bacterium]